MLRKKEKMPGKIEASISPIFLVHRQKTQNNEAAGGLIKITTNATSNGTPP
jgi:hypothetical protein